MSNKSMKNKKRKKIPASVGLEILDRQYQPSRAENCAKKWICLDCR